MLKQFESFEEVAKSYTRYLSKGGGGMYLHTIYRYTERSFLYEFFAGESDLKIYMRKNKDELNPYDVPYSLYLARVLNVTDLCMNTKEVEVTWVDQDENIHCSRVQWSDLYHYDIGYDTGIELNND